MRNQIQQYWHGQYGCITNKNRNTIYSNWIKQVGVKNKVVLDGGAGTGIWGYHALVHGADHVIQVEWNDEQIPFLENLRNNSEFKDKITIIHGDLRTNFNYPEPDIIILENIGSRFYNEDIHGTTKNLRDAWPNAKIIPDEGQLVISWIEGKDDQYRDYGYNNTENIKNYNGVINVEMPDTWIKEINKAYDHFTKTPTITQIDPNWWPDYISVDKSDIFFLGDPLFEFTSTSPELANFATLQFFVGIDNDMITTSKFGLSVSSTYASIKTDNTVKFECCNMAGWPGNLYAEWKASWL